MSTRLAVYIDGAYAGSLEQDFYGEVIFTYADKYDGVDLSVMMPCASGDASYKGHGVRAWFDNLLPDNPVVREAMAENKNVKPTIIPLLCHYGLDLPGAIQVVSDDFMEEFQSREYCELPTTYGTSCR